MTPSTIREAVITDTPYILKHLKEMHANTSFKETHFDYEKTRINLQSFITNETTCVFVLEVGNIIVGMFLGAVSDHWWGNSLYTSDVLLYISPEHRKCKGAPKLINAYIQWAKSFGVEDSQINLGVSTEVDVERTSMLYSSLGFVNKGVLFKYKG